jgi:acyl-CoA synthetase (NDP forming)
LAVIAVSAQQVCEVAEKAIRKGAKGLVVVSAGFAESGEEGKAIQKKLVNIVRMHGVRLVGPSCLGIINTGNSINMNASLAPKMIRRGSAGFFSHSAALGIVVLKYAAERGIGFTSFVSAGNRADVSGNDLLQFWEEDPDTKYAILYLETFGNPRRFVRIARRMSYKKPLLCVKSARSSVGRKAVEAKSGAAVDSKPELKALFAQTGMIVTETLEELFDVAVILSHQPLPEGNNVGIIANSAGMATLFADAGESNGLCISESALINLGAFALPSDYESAVKKLLLDKNVNSLLIGFAGLGNIDPREIFKAITKGIAEARRTNGQAKPIVLCFMGEFGTLSLSDEGGSLSSEIPTFRFPEAAARALAKTVEYSNFVRNPAGKLLWFEDVRPDEARKLVASLLHKLENDETIEVSKENSKKILNMFGLNFDANGDGKEININVNPDPLFGPTIKITDSNALNTVRITPLTESDLKETMKEMGLDDTHPVGEFIGRISQLIEEIPWLWELKTVVLINGTCRIKEAEITLKPGGSKLPNY